MRRMRLLFALAAFFLAIGAAVTKLGNELTATPAVTSVATAVPVEVPATPTQQFATSRPLVATEIRTAEPSVTMYVDADGLNLRDKPAGAIVGSVPHDTELRVNIAGEWALVTEGIHKGKYVAARYLRPAK